VFVASAGNVAVAVVMAGCCVDCGSAVAIPDMRVSREVMMWVRIGETYVEYRPAKIKPAALHSLVHFSMFMSWLEKSLEKSLKLSIEPRQP